MAQNLIYGELKTVNEKRPPPNTFIETVLLNGESINIRLKIENNALNMTMLDQHRIQDHNETADWNPHDLIHLLVFSKFLMVLGIYLTVFK